MVHHTSLRGYNRVHQRFPIHNLIELDSVVFGVMNPHSDAAVATGGHNGAVVWAISQIVDGLGVRYHLIQYFVLSVQYDTVSLG